MHLRKLLVLAFLCSVVAFSQTTIKGSVFNEYLEPVSGASVEYNNQKIITDYNGDFEISRATFPLKITVKMIGYKAESIKLSEAEDINVILKENITLDEIVVSASRTPERIFEAPVAIERFNIKSVKRNTGVSFYDGMQNLRGVDVATNSSVYKLVNTRSFATLQNTRFVQLYDGADNVMPSNSTSLGSMFGISDLDVESVEVLQGPASALYGANAFNGIMLVKSKNPFEHSGVSVEMKSGVTKQKAGGMKPFYNPNVRLAVKFNDKFAVKGNFSYFTGEEWHATDYRSISDDGTIQDISERDDMIYGYNGINVYGDDIKFDGLFSAGKIGNVDIRIPLQLTRKGYRESDLLENYSAKNIVYDGTLYYRPLGNEKLQFVLSSKMAKGTNILQLPPARYQQKNRKFNQHKIEVSGDFFSLRGYYSRVNSGDSYKLGNLAEGILREWKPYIDWVADVESTADRKGGVANPDVLVETIKSIDSNMPIPGTEAFLKSKETLVSKDIRNGGAKELDNTRLYHFDVDLDLKNYINWIHFQLGSSFRRYVLDSNENIFSDKDKPIIYDESGMYLQARKKFIDDRLSLAFSGRYDKSKNFEGKFTPRATISYLAGKDKNNLFRFAYQTAFRNPTPQDQYRTYLSGYTAVGTAQDNLERAYILVENPEGKNEKLTTKEIMNNSFTYKSVRKFLRSEPYLAFLANGEKVDELLKDNTYERVLKKADFKPVKPEEVKSFELGYRGMYNVSNKILEIDLSGFYSTYTNFITNVTVMPITNEGKADFSDYKKVASPKDFFDLPLALQTLLGAGKNNPFSIATNSKTEINSFGASLSLKSKIFNGFDLGLSYDWAKYTYDEKVDPDFKPGFNSPEHTVKLQFGHHKLFKNFGFNSAFKWQSAFLWQSPYLEGHIDKRFLLDAQINYSIPKIRSRIKIGGSNLLGKEYFGALGSGLIGSSYYLSWVIND